MTIRRTFGEYALAIAALTLGSIASGYARADAAPTCAQLPQSLAGVPTIKSASSAIVAASGSDAAYCRVTLRYGATANQNINIVIALPLSAADGGSGGVQGAWNGRTQGLGGGGCQGNMFTPPLSSPSRAVNAGYVASGNDLGHEGGSCEAGVNPDGTYNRQFIEDFVRDGIKQQVLWSKAVTKIYYSQDARYNYWSGCSTGGRQGYLLAQELPGELQGILASDPAMYWTRLASAQMWGQIAMLEHTGGPIAPAKLEQTRLSTIAACDKADGVVDGVIDDPRTCRFSATANICGNSGAPPENCLTELEAVVVDKIWDGPRNAKGNRLWFGLERGSSFNSLNGATPIVFGPWQLQWNMRDRKFDWKTVSLAEFPDVLHQGVKNLADFTDTDKPLDGFKASGSKLLAIQSASDSGIFPRAQLHYYRLMAARYGGRGEPDFSSLQDFYRLFRAPGLDHCGGSANTIDPFAALVTWVEQGVAPDYLIVSGGPAGGPSVGRTRPICLYPQTAIYNGSGSTDDVRSYHCGGNLETRATVCQDVLTRYKDEKTGDLDFNGTGVSVKACQDSDTHSNE